MTNSQFPIPNSQFPKTRSVTLQGAECEIENHCPICAAATACTGLCRQELEVFQTVLGQDAVIARTEHIVAGERRCVYQVRASQ